MVFNVSTDDVRGTFMLKVADRDKATFIVEPFVLKELAAPNPDAAGTQPREMLKTLPDDANPMILFMR